MERLHKRLPFTFCNKGVSHIPSSASFTGVGCIRDAAVLEVN